MSKEINDATLRQSLHLLKLIGDKKFSEFQMNSLIESGVMSDLLDVKDLKKIDRNEFRKLLRLQSFSLLVDFGVVTVPEDYDSLESLSFLGTQKNLKKTGNSYIFLSPGDKFNVKAFANTLDGFTTELDDRIAFLKTQKAILLAEHGAIFLAEQKKHFFSRYKYQYSFHSLDEHYRLWVDGNHASRIPAVSFDGKLFFESFDHHFYRRQAFLCFSKIED